MQNNERARRIHAATGGLIFCLLISSLLGSLLPTALSLVMQSNVIGSSGSITYPSLGLLKVTDTTPESAITFQVDGSSYHPNGTQYLDGERWYSLSSTVPHTIELPSPYTAESSGITYYFSHWQGDASTDNPRTITLSPGEALHIHGVYSTSQDPPPPPGGGNGTKPSPYEPPSMFLAYSGFEASSEYTLWDEGYLSTNWGSQWYDHYVDYVSDSSYEVAQGWTSDDVSAPFGDQMLAMCHDRYVQSGAGSRIELQVFTSGQWYFETYVSVWMYVPSDADLYGGSSSNWVSIMANRETSGGTNYGNNMYWYQPYHDVENMAWEIAYRRTGSSYTWGVRNDQTKVPIGRWFRVEYYLYRHPTDGIVKVWLTDTDPSTGELLERIVLFDETGRKTKQNTGTSDHLHTSAFIKLYGECTYGDYKPYLRYHDDLYICETYPYNDWTPQK